jgi:peptidoglycan/LPS O-acetylase OafA/YrhL
LETQQASHAPRRFPAIAALRGVLVLWVVLHHVHVRFSLNHYPVGTLLPKPLSRVVFWSGYYAVVMFFVVSGFLITHHSLRRWQALPGIQLGAFYWLRFTRIYPCLLLLLVVLSCLHLLGVSGYVIDAQRSSLARAALAALTFHFNWLEGSRGYLPGGWDVLWSLSVEEAFYLLFPLACLGLRRESLIVALLLVLIAVGPVSRVLTQDDIPWDEYAYLSCLDCIAFGCLAAWLQQRAAGAREPSLWRTRIRLAVGALLMGLVIVARETTVALGLVDTGLYISVLALGSALVLWAFADARSEAALRGSAWLRSIGESSYEIYLTHMFVVMATLDFFRASGADMTWVFGFYLAAVWASVALGWLVARCYGQPLAAALRRRSARLKCVAVSPPLPPAA